MRRPTTQAYRAAKARAGVNFIRRVVAGPGDKVAAVDGGAVLNGKHQADPLTELAATARSATSRFRPTLTS